MARIYCMTPAQSDDWTLGGEAATQVEHEIAEDIQDAGITDDVDVLVDDESVAFSVWQTA
jgi:hypothetical protein